MGIKMIILILIITIGILLYFLFSNLYELFLKRHPPKENPMDFFNSYERKYEEVKENLIETPLSNNSFPQCLNDLEFSTYPTEQELKTRYRELAKKYHPDKGGNAKDFEKISKAYNEALKIIKLRKGE